MTEESAEQAKSAKGPEHADDDKCPDPFGPYTRYRINAEIAKKREALFTADATAMATRYDRLAGAQQKYADAWAGQKKAWADLACQVERIRDNLQCALDQATRTTLECCWYSLSQQTAQATQPADCKDVAKVDCQKLLDDVTKLEPDKLAEALASWRRQAAHAQTCVSQADKAFDDLADFPEQLPNLIADLKAKADKIDEALAKPGNDAQRSYVEYLALHHAFCELWRKLITAAAYTCQLKLYFVNLLGTHQAWICLQVAIHGAEQREGFEDDAKKAKAENLIDLVIECARPAKPDDGAKPQGDCPPPGDCPPTPPADCPPDQKQAPAQQTGQTTGGSYTA
jgi:hypothetical protein